MFSHVGAKNQARVGQNHSANAAKSKLSAGMLLFRAMLT